MLQGVHVADILLACRYGDAHRARPARRIRLKPRLKSRRRVECGQSPPSQYNHL